MAIDLVQLRTLAEAKYEDRPADCSEYPYLYEPHLATRTIAMLARIPTCPIVYDVVEDLKKSLGFFRRRR